MGRTSSVYREAVELLAEVHRVDPPMPADDRSDAEWDAWVDLQSFQATMAGYVGQLSSSAWVERSSQLDEAVRALEDARLQEMAGERFEAFERLLRLVRSVAR